MPEARRTNRSRTGAAVTHATAASPIFLDFTRNAALPTPLLRRLDRIAAEQTGAFNNLLAELALGRKNAIDWWVTLPASRSIHTSSMFDYCAWLGLVRALLNEGHTLHVRTENPAFAKVLRREEITVGRVGARRYWTEKWRQHIWNVGSCVFHSVAGFLAARRTRALARPLAPGLLTILETVVSEDSVVDGRFEDRYFAGATDALSADARQHLVYLPVFYRVRRYHKLLAALRLSGENFIIPQDYLRLRDYAFAAGHWWRSRRLVGRTADFAGFDVGPLVDAELKAGRSAQSTFLALLHYRLWRRLKEGGLPIKRLIEWYEGQNINHATAAALNWHVPGVQHYGFRPLGASIDVGLTPSSSEVAAGVAPRILAVNGTRVRREIEESERALNICAAPGFRYQQISNLRRVKRTGRVTILVVLSGVPRLVTSTRALLDFEDARDAQWLVKRHPVMPQREAERYFGAGLPDSVQFVDGAFYDWLVRADLVIGIETSTLVEAIALGIPVICLGEGNRPSRVPIPAWVDQRLWRISYDRAGTRRAMSELLDTDLAAINLNQLQDDLMSPATPESTRRFFDVE